MIKITNHGGCIEISGLDKEMKTKVMKTFVLPNPAYHTLMRMGNYRAAQWAGEFVKYYREDKQGTMWLGRGCLSSMTTFLERSGIQYQYEEDVILDHPAQRVEVNATLRPYQVAPFEAFKVSGTSSGVIALSTGWGKSLFALKMIEHLQVPTLILVPRGHLLSQFCKDIKAFCGIEAGVIQGKRFAVKFITVATVQTAKKYSKEIANLFTMVIVDEAHLAVTKQVIALIQSLRCKFLYGMSGSPLRSDQQHEALKWIFGKPVVEDYMAHATPTVHVHYSDAIIPVRQYSEIIEAQTEDEDRNALIAKLTLEHAKAGRKVLTLTKRVMHTQTLAELMPDCGIIPIYAQSPQAIKAELMEKLRKNEMDFNGILATIALFGTGSDVPSLDTCIIACDLKSRATQIQAIGRILRAMEGKKDPLIVEIVDNLNPVLFRQWKERLKYYKEMGWKIEQL